MKILKSLRRKLKIKLSLMQEKRRRRSGRLYPRNVPQHLSQIDLGEELTRVPSITSFQNHPPREASLISHISTTTDLYSERESSEELFPGSLSLLSSRSFIVEQSAADEGFCDFSQRFIFPVKTGENVQLSELELRADSWLNGTVKVANLAYNKTVFVRWSTDNWISYQDTVASYGYSSEEFTHDWFSFTLHSSCMPDDTVPAAGKSADDGGSDSGVCVELAVAYRVNGMEFWDNNNGENFQLLLN